MNCIHNFSGATKKGRPFHGWAGRVTDWPAKAAPKVEFGKWTPDKSNVYNGGTTTFDCNPFDLVMFGANSKTMDSRDKSTKFGFAGLGPDGTLRITYLPSDSDARKLFKLGGWVPPTPEEITRNLLSQMQENTITLSQLNAEIALVKSKTIEGFGIRLQQFDETLAFWPILTPIHNALAEAVILQAEMRNKGSAARLLQAQIEVRRAASTLRENEVELSNASIAAFLINETNQSAHIVKEKVRYLKKVLGDEYFRI